MGLFKKIWHWLFGKKEVGSYEEIKAKCLKDVPVTYNTGGYIKNAERYVAPRYSESTYNTVARNNNDNFLTGAMVGYLFADSLNNNTASTHRNVEETKSSNYESSYTPSSSSSYDSGSYSSSFDSGSSSSSCDSGC